MTLVPFIDAAGELKTKPTQHSVNELRRIGIHPDVVVCRSTEPLSDDIREKIALFADVDPTAVVGCPDVPDVYLVPEVLQAEGLDSLVCEQLGLEAPAAELGEWSELIERTRELREDVEIALVGKYVKLHDAYLSVHEALKHAGVHSGLPCARPLGGRREHVLRGGRARARAGRRRARPGRVRLARVGGEDPRLPCRARAGDPVPRHLPRHARRGLRVRAPCRGMDGANSTEMDPETPFPVIDLLPEQKEIEDLGGTMRLGAQAVELDDGTRARDAYGEPVVHERHRHRYEVNNELRQQLVDAGLVVSGTFQDGRLVEIVELPDHPWFVASQFHPEFKSRPTRPAPLFREFVSAALDRARSRSAVRAAAS